MSATPPRQRIIDAAIACFVRDGFHGASMQQICAEANMSPGALYRYFPSKVSIIAAIAEAERAQHTAFFERLAAADDPVEAMADMGLDKLEELIARPTAALSIETMAEAMRNPDIRGMFDRNKAEAHAAMTAALKRGQERGFVDPGLDVGAACALIMCMGDGLTIHQGLDDPTLKGGRFRPMLEVLLRRFLRPAAAAVLLMLLVAGGARAADAPASAPVNAPLARPPSVTVVPAATGAITETAVLTGTLVAREEVMVSPQIDALAITSLDAEEGDRVEAGQVLARLQRDALDASVAQNTAQVARAEAAISQARSAIAEGQANREQADLAFNRTRDLFGSGNASRETFEQRQAAARTAVARLEAAQNALRVAEADRALALAQRQELLVRLARTEVRAPVAGVVSRRTARLGAVVAGAGDALFRIIQDGAVELEADVPEAQLAKLRPGQAAVVDTVTGARAGHVRLVAPEVSRTTRLGRVRVALDGTDTPVIGSFARAAVVVARHEGVLCPLSAVLFQPGGAVVQVVRDGTVETRPVRIGLRSGGTAEVTEGLAPGEAVVAVSGTFIRGGDRVTPVAAPVAAAG